MAQVSEDTACAPPPRPVVSKPAEEGTRPISSDIPVFSTLHASAIGAIQLDVYHKQRCALDHCLLQVHCVCPEA